MKGIIMEPTMKKNKLILTDKQQEIMDNYSPEKLNGVVKPNHYTKFAIEPITFIMKNNLPFFAGNIIKYTTRAGSKVYNGMNKVESEIADLEKVRRYAEMRINQLKGEDVL